MTNRISSSIRSSICVASSRPGCGSAGRRTSADGLMRPAWPVHHRGRDLVPDRLEPGTPRVAARQPDNARSVPATAELAEPAA